MGENVKSDVLYGPRLTDQLLDTDQGPILHIWVLV